MYQFAMLLGAARGTLRKGAMWFIKYVSLSTNVHPHSTGYFRDPQDPTFHPIRDILDRPTASQLRKLGVSALMYSFVIFGGLGSAILLVRMEPFTQLLPLRWNPR